MIISEFISTVQKTVRSYDAIARNKKVSFCVIDYNNVVPEKYTTYFRSVIAFGKARILENPEDKMKAIEKLVARYSPNHEEGRKKEINDQFKQLCLVEIEIEYMTGKEANNIDEQALDVKKAQEFVNKQEIMNNILKMSQSKAEALGVSRSRFQGIKQRIRENRDLNLKTPAVKRLII